ncbi:MAG: hypothetical protein NZ455_07400 [Bacteroidia bacterium]|nr:hypothetical protein [Bacteroidia bacterium]MDW8345910.1 hypothetical protein [Bacteroidia bacterium]
MRHAEGVRQHGAKPLAHSFTLAQGVGRSTVSPQHADLVGMSAAKRPQGHAQKNFTDKKSFHLVYFATLDDLLELYK